VFTKFWERRVLIGPLGSFVQLAEPRHVCSEPTLTPRLDRYLRYRCGTGDYPEAQWSGEF